MIAQMSEYSLIGNYSILVCRKLILYDIISGRYVVKGNSSFLSLLLILYIYNTNKKKIYKDLRSHKSYTNYGTQIFNLKQE